MKKIYLFAIGGTISYLKGKAGRKDGKQILEETGLDKFDDMEIVIKDIISKPSSDMQIEDLFIMAKEVQSAILEGADGIVITQGTDTIEETAFFLELTIPNVVPVIVTGAMKHTGLLGADGGANLKAAIMAASSEILRHEGCMVVFDEMILPAWYVRKTNTQSLDTFKSQFGPVGYFSEGKIRLIAHSVKPDTDYKFGREVLEEAPARVCTHSVSIGDDGKMLEYVIEAGYTGLVIEGLGGGHCTTEMAERIRQISDKIPVIMSSRTGSGEVQTDTYTGYPGSEAELIKSGVIYAGILDSAKARILLILMLTAKKTIDEIRTEISEYCIFD